MALRHGLDLAPEDMRPDEPMDPLPPPAQQAPANAIRRRQQVMQRL